MTSAWALGTFAAGGREFAGLVVGQRVHPLEDIAGLSRPTVRDLLDHWPVVEPRLDQLAAEAPPEYVDLDAVEVRAPVEPRQVFQSGANYRTHVLDLAMAHGELADGRPDHERRAAVAAELDDRAAHGDPYVFTGLPSAICGPYDDVVLPAGSAKNDWELELVAVVGAPARNVPRERALEVVAGFTITNDLTMREHVFRRDMKEIGTDWLRSKNAPTFLPLGPFIVPPRFVGPVDDLRLTLRLNDEVWQDESTKDMLFDVAAVVSYCSRVAQLLPGDLILTGSPAGNGAPKGRFLRDGDVMVGEITGLGALRNACIDEAARPR